MLKQFPTPNPTEFPTFYNGYVQLAIKSGVDIIKSMVSSEKDFKKMISLISEEKLMFRYAEGKWTIKDIIVHLTDAERIFSYRLLRSVRDDVQPYAPFEENDYVVSAEANRRNITNILNEFSATRKSTIELLKTLETYDLPKTGVNTSGLTMSVNALAHVILGHMLHHQTIIQTRYI